jgi:phage terminase small subunit
MALSDKQKRFVEEYMVDLNATQSAIRAGYSLKTAHSIGAENLTKPEIQEAIQQRQKEISEATNISAKRILEEYAKIAFSDVRELFTPDNNLYDIRQLDDSTAGAVASIEIDALLVQGMQVGETKKVKMYDKLKALDALGRHIGLFERDNNQKKNESVNIINLGGGVKPKEDE